MKKILSPIFFVFITAVYANSAMLTFTFPDGVSSQRDGIAILSKYNMVGVINMIAKRVDKKGHLSVDDLLNAQNLGWEITSHSYRHPNFLKLSYEEADHELSYSKTYLENLGLRITNFTAPYGAWNDSLNNLALKYYRSVEVGGNGLNSYPVKPPFILYSYPVLYTTTVQEVKNLISSGIAQNKWVIINLHKFGSDPAKPENIYWWSKDNFEELVSWVQKQNIQVVTIQEMIEEQIH
jgi:peptidoglycan/xylan/chitin deacetylase (PgdA/CDA1 family)